MVVLVVVRGEIENPINKSSLWVYNCFFMVYNNSLVLNPHGLLPISSRHRWSSFLSSIVNLIVVEK